MRPARLLAVTLAAAPGQAARRTPCIQLSASSATEYVPVDDHTIVVRSFDQWWRLTVTPSSLLLQPQAFLVNDIRGTSTLCSRSDFDLSVLEHPGGGREGLIVQDFTAITPEEGKALRRAAHR